MDSNLFTYLWPLFNLVVLLAVGIYYGREPLGRLLASHEQQVADSLDGASNTRAEAEEEFERQKSRWEEIEEDIDEIRRQAEQARERLRRRRRRQAEAEREHITSRVQDAMRRERDEAVEQLREEMSSKLVAGVQRAVSQLVSPQDHRRLAEHLVDEMEDAS